MGRPVPGEGGTLQPVADGRLATLEGSAVRNVMIGSTFMEDVYADEPPMSHLLADSLPPCRLMPAGPRGGDPERDGLRGHRTARAASPGGQHGERRRHDPCARMHDRAQC